MRSAFELNGHFNFLVPAGGVEPPASRLRGERSSQLSYTGKHWSVVLDSNQRYSCSQSRRHTGLGEQRLLLAGAAGIEPAHGLAQNQVPYRLGYTPTVSI